MDIDAQCAFVARRLTCKCGQNSNQIYQIRDKTLGREALVMSQKIQHKMGPIIAARF